jgi:hypothetical protein
MQSSSSGLENSPDTFWRSDDAVYRLSYYPRTQYALVVVSNRLGRMDLAHISTQSIRRNKNEFIRHRKDKR